MSHIPEGDWRGVAMFGGDTYPPRWWRPLRTAFAWFGFLTLVRLVWGLF